jgi:hypothetical protein
MTKRRSLLLIKYESYKRTKAILSLKWDLNGKPHEITMLKIKHTRLNDKYDEGEIPHEAKMELVDIIRVTIYIKFNIAFGFLG